MTEAIESLRLDKWLWAARLFKTRHLACEAVNGGHVAVNGHRAKPGRAIQPGARLHITKGTLEWDLVVKGLSRQRGPAAVAALLYEECEASRDRRQALVHERRELGAAPETRPNKRDRRLIHRFLEGTG